jgi:hypothetical protein
MRLVTQAPVSNETFVDRGRARGPAARPSGRWFGRSTAVSGTGQLTALCRLRQL